MPFCSQGVISSARRSAKAEVRGANPRESANFQAPVPQQLQGEFRKLVFVGASPTRGSSFKSGSWCNSSISPCEGDGPGANPRESTISLPLCLQQLQGGFRKPAFVGASPTRGSSLMVIMMYQQHHAP